jgi:hypothetical protein
MNQPDLSIYEPLFTASDFTYGADERYCGHRVVDLRDGVVTARATFLNKPPTKDNFPKFDYASKPLPGRAPELTEQKQGI